MNRRNFLHLAGLASASFALPRALRAATTAPRVVIVGGGFAGATAAKYLKLWGGNIDVTLIDRNAEHYACILSNLVVTGQLPIELASILNLRSLVLDKNHLNGTIIVRFDQMKALMAKKALSTSPDFNKEFEIHTDASTLQLIARISQKENQ